MAFEFEGYNFEEYSGPKPFVCDPVLLAKKFIKKSKAFRTSQSVYLYKMLANDITREPLLCCKTDADSSAVLEQAKQIGFDIEEINSSGEVIIKRKKLSWVCITELPEFQRICLGPDSLRMCLEDPDNTHISFVPNMPSTVKAALLPYGKIKNLPFLGPNYFPKDYEC